jgi:hypothetical protein
MAEEPDYELNREVDPPPGAVLAPRAPALWPILTLLLLAALGAAYFWLNTRRSAPTAPVTSEAGPAARGADAPAAPLGGEPDAIDVPPLDESDALVRQLVGKLSSHPAIAAWLATDGLIRSFTAVVLSVADGKSPARQLTVVRPAAEFSVIERNGQLYIDPQSYERYNALADAAASLDPAGSARLYATLRPRIEEANRDLGFPNTSFDRTFERALQRLLETPAVQDPIRVEALPKGIGYRFADPRLESLSGAQRQLIRMGARNQRMVQDSLRRLAGALGSTAIR